MDRMVFTCCHVLREGAEVRHVSIDDGDIQVLCIGGDHGPATNAAVVHLQHLVDRDASILAALEGLAEGQVAYRRSCAQPWVVARLPPEEDAA